MRAGLSRAATVVVAAALAACSETPTSSVKSTTPTTVTDPGEGAFVVVLREGAPGTTVLARGMMKQFAVEPRWVSENEGVFTADLTANQAAVLQQDPRVLVVEQNGRAHPDLVSGQSSAPWHLDILSVPLDGWFTYSETGAGVNLYIVDLPVNPSHVELAPRVEDYFDAIGYHQQAGCPGELGHGTPVASAAAGLTYGVAKGATIHSVIVFSCDGYGTPATVVAGLRWILANAKLPAVVNMSLQSSSNRCTVNPPGGGGPITLTPLDKVCPGAADPGVDALIAQLTAKNITVVASAGNASGDACNQTPADAPSAITVGAVDQTLHRSLFTNGKMSNYGGCVALFAPGSNVLVASDMSNTSTVAAEGTSLSAPLVAGAAALYLERYPLATAAAVKSAIVSQAQTNILYAPTLGANSPNRFLRYTFRPLTPTMSGPYYASNAYATVVATQPQNGSLYYKWSYTFCANSSLPSDCNGASYPGPSGVDVKSMTLYVNSSELWMTWKVQVSLFAGSPIIGTNTFTVDGAGINPGGGGGGGPSGPH